MTRKIKVGEIEIGGNLPFVLIAGPCVLEREEEALEIAGKIKEITRTLEIPFIFKSSYDKANRSSHLSYRGPGIERGLKILERIKKEIKVPVLSDIHRVEEIKPASQVLDIIQIPAFLCRQTDLIQEAGCTKKPVNVKKGQFLSPQEMKNVIQKIEAVGNQNILLTERGTFFGYNNLVVDMRSLVIMRKYGYPVVFDTTHSVQTPGGEGKVSGGEPEFIFPLARGAVAVGIDALFIEVHPEPERALSDAKSMFRLSKLPQILTFLKELDRMVKNQGL